MSSTPPNAPTTLVWQHGRLLPTTSTTDSGPPRAADSFLLRDGRVLALALHRHRFLTAVAGEADAADFWNAAIAAIPRTGDWFPRVELLGGHSRSNGAGDSDSAAPLFRCLIRPAPARERSVVVRTHTGPDPRTAPRVKGPDLAALSAARNSAAAHGAGEIVIASPVGFIAEGGYSALVWWRGESLCLPAPELERIDSVTANVLVTVATALGIEVLWETATPNDLDGLEVWCVNALHGIRLVTEWIDGPQVAELPGRLAVWRARLGKLSRAVDTLQR